VEPSSGHALIADKDVSRESLETKKLLTYIPENLTLYPNLDGLENLDYFTGLAGKKYGYEELHNFLTQAGLQTDAHAKRVSAYSKGMRQKVGIALALAKDARVL
ncbi:MAG TPA: ATP-binding cassette domain-containing protein, partial [Cyclobacteriaceae bacterium]|nr:ATP-binding cassette domain-containing protein [Cyclobacteriaceae bacterium]